jgi:hypothetical protein
MFPTMKRIFLLISAVRVAACVLGLAALAFSSGCLAAATGAGAGAVAYVRGELDATVDASPDRTVWTVGRAVQQLEFAKVSESKDALLSITVVRNAADKKIEIRTERMGAALTRIKIRVGVFGDEALAQAILDKIKSSL